MITDYQINIEHYYLFCTEIKMICKYFTHKSYNFWILKPKNKQVQTNFNSYLYKKKNI